jgi:hypothetical protein
MTGLDGTRPCDHAARRSVISRPRAEALAAGQILRRHHMTRVMLLEEPQEIVRPAQRTIDPKFFRVQSGIGNSGVVDVERQGVGGCSTRRPAEDGHSRVSGQSGQVDAHSDHSGSVVPSLR